MGDRDILNDFRSHQAEWLASLAGLVTHESPSRDKPSLDALAVTLAARFAAIGGSVAIEENADGGDHVRVRFFDHVSGKKPALLLAHYDTVWPLGTLATMPFRLEGGKAHGPGVFDMKASIILAEMAIDALRRFGITPPRPVEFLITSDEEIGSPTSRALIEARAREAQHVLVLEPPLADGSLKTARKGVGGFTVEVEGRAAHAGVEPEKGIDAIREMAGQILRIHELADPAEGTTVNVGELRGGTTSNVVPAHAWAKVDVRAKTLAEARRIEAAMLGLTPIHPGARLTIRGGFNRPPMERTPAVADLFARARACGLKLGLDLGEGATGGGSDGNFTAALGVPTIDGLGVHGAGAHASHEHIVVESLAERAALLAMLLTDL
ncbi:M20 family metallopeptidase [Tundrisphaera sp. TA3]|uniref:M20 family metallopeptidase n=1 Tax=Tundrisphaera sp. TA3 TaxID=3435775 RepID=UPI003EBD3281